MTGKEFEEGYKRLNELLLEAQLAGGGKTAKMVEVAHLRRELLAEANFRGYHVITDIYMAVHLQRPIPIYEYVVVEEVETEIALLKFMAMEMRVAAREAKASDLPLTDLDKQLIGG